MFARASSTSDLRLLFLTVFLDMVAFAIILPALPFYAMELGATGLGVGILLTSYSAAKLLGATIVGRLSDSYGRRLLLILCLAGSGLSFILTGLAGSLVALALARGIAGLFGGTVGVAQAYIADLTAPQERAKYMGLVGASVGLAFIVGPGLGVGLSRFGFPLVAYAGAALAFANTLLAVWCVKESPRTTTGLGAPMAQLHLAMGPGGIRRVLMATFMTIFAFVSMETTLAFVAHDRFGIQERGFGLVLVYVGTVMILVQGGLMGRLAPRFGERQLATAGGLLLGTAMLCLPFAPAIGIALAILGVLAFGQGLLSPSLATLLSRYTARDGQGGMLGLGQSVSSAARAIAPVVAGWLYDQATGSPFFLAGLLALSASAAIAGLARWELVGVREDRA